MAVEDDRADYINAYDTKSSAEDDSDFEEVKSGKNPCSGADRVAAPWDSTWEVGRHLGAGRNGDVYQCFRVGQPEGAHCCFVIKMSFNIPKEVCEREANHLKKLKGCMAVVQIWQYTWWGLDQKKQGNMGCIIME